MFRPKQNRLLALDGAGILGVISLGALCQVRRHTGDLTALFPEFIPHGAKRVNNDRKCQ